MSSQKRIAQILVFAVVVAAVANPVAALLTYDGETTNSASTSDFVGGETATDLENESKMKTIQVISDNATTSTLTNPEEAFTVEMTVSDSENRDTNHTFYMNDSTFTVVNASAGHYAITLSHAEMFAELPREPGENVTVDVTTTFNATEADEESATITVYAQNGMNTSVDAITDEDLAESQAVDTTNKSRWWATDLDYASYENSLDHEDNVTHRVVIANDTVEGKYTQAYDAGTFASKDYIWSMTAHVDDDPIMVFDQTRGDGRDPGWISGGFDAEKDTYATFHLNGGEHGDDATLEVVPQGEDNSAESLTIESEGNKKLGYWKTLGNFGGDAAEAAGIGEAVA